MRNPYDILGVEAGVGVEEIRAAYLKRAKVLHPDRFNSSTQAVEWQMANDMLRELNAAYEQVHADAEKRHDNEFSKRPPKYSPPPTSIDEGKSSKYMDEIGMIMDGFTKYQIAPIQGKDFDPQIKSLEHLVRLGFESELKAGSFDQNSVDPLVVEAGEVGVGGG